MLSILLLSKRGEGYELIDRIRKDGHIAKLWIEDAQVRHIYKTILHAGQVIDRYEESLELADLVISTSTGFGRQCDRVRESGRLALGGGIQDLLISDELMYTSASKLIEVDAYKDFIVGAFDKKWIGLYDGLLYSRLLEGDRGPLTEGMGSLIWQRQQELIGMESLLVDNNFQGFIGVYFGEKLKFFNPVSTCIFPALMECAIGGLVDWMMALASSSNHRRVKTGQFGLSARISYLEPTPELVLHPDAEKHFWRHYEPGSFGYFAASGENAREARRRVVRSIENNVPRNCVYRRDLGEAHVY